MASERPPSFWLRALVAFGWAATFHVCAVLVALAWALVPLLLFPERWPAWTRWLGVVVTVVSGLVLLRQTVWVKDPFRAPTRPLARGEHERLQALVRETAAALGTPPPSEIYLLPDASASALEVRRGLFGRRRVLLVGLGLLNACTVVELRAAIAHEMAHFIGGDALLAPMLARVRHGLLRLHDEIAGSVASLPLLLYADGFLRVTQSISREQERWADRAAARLAGSDALGRLLERQARADLVYALLLRSGVNVLLAAGLRPRNLYDGLRRFERTASQDEGRKLVDAVLQKRAQSPYDSHPPLDERLSLLRAIKDGEDVPERTSRDDDHRLARELLDDPEQVEERVTGALFDERGHLPLIPVEWDEVAARAVLPALEEGAKSAREQVARLFGPERARSDEGALKTLLDVLARPPSGTGGGARYDALAETFRRALQPHVAALLARTLLRRGGRLVVEVGRPFLIHLDEGEYDPEAIAEEAVRQPSAATALREKLRELPPVEPSRPQIRAQRAADDEKGDVKGSQRERETEGEERATEG